MTSPNVEFCGSLTENVQKKFFYQIPLTWSKTYRYLYPSINYLIWPFWRKPKTNKSPIKELVCVRCNQTNNRNIKEWSWTLLYVQVNHSQKVAFFHHFIETFFRTAILSKNSNVFEHGLWILFSSKYQTFGLVDGQIFGYFRLIYQRPF